MVFLVESPNTLTGFAVNSTNCWHMVSVGWLKCCVNDMEVSLLYSLFSLVFNVNLWDSKTSMQCSYQSLCSSAYFKMSKAAELLAWYNNDVSLKLSSNMLTIKSESRKINWFLLGKTYWITCSLIKNFENRRSRKSWKLPKREKKNSDKNSLNFQFDKIFLLKNKRSHEYKLYSWISYEANWREKGVVFA